MATRMIRREYAGEVKDISSRDQTLTLAISTETPDRYGDVVEVGGWLLDNYLKNPVVLFGHNYGGPAVGQALKTWAVKRDKALYSTMKFAPTPTGQELWLLYSQGFMRASSVGFMPIDFEKLDENADEFWGPFRFKTQELWEYSLVPVPANPDAIVQFMAKMARGGLERQVQGRGIDFVAMRPISLVGDPPPPEGVLTVGDTGSASAPDGVLVLDASGGTWKRVTFGLPMDETIVAVPEPDSEPTAMEIEMGFVQEGGPSAVERPYPNEHACRLREPGDFEENSFRRSTREHEGKEYSVIMGKLKGDSAMTEQAYRYAKDTWTASEAKAHCSEHDGEFEAASGGENDVELADKARALLDSLQRSNWSPSLDAVSDTVVLALDVLARTTVELDPVTLLNLDTLRRLTAEIEGYADPNEATQDDGGEGDNLTDSERLWQAIDEVKSDVAGVRASVDTFGEQLATFLGVLADATKEDGDTSEPSGRQEPAPDSPPSVDDDTEDVESLAALLTTLLSAEE